ncbi:MAG: stress response translation initiation inhibitor YciH [Thermoplasmata archaeon]|nr:stress response translation initiation inhibitor YciH [Thermoplasmata archaeon]
MGKICPKCGLPEEICVCEEIAREAQQIKVFTVRRRYGKIMTIVEGINTSDIDIDELARTLKTKCASGGTVKDGNIELQGNHKRRITDELIRMGFNVDVRS